MRNITIWEYNPKNNYGVKSTLEEIQNINNEIIITHYNASTDKRSTNYWIESYGLVDYCITTLYDNNTLVQKLAKKGYTVKYVNKPI